MGVLSRRGLAGALAVVQAAASAAPAAPKPAAPPSLADADALAPRKWLRKATPDRRG